MFKVALKGVLARKGRVITTAIAVILGVAFVTGTLVLSDTITKVFNDLFADVTQGTDAIVREESTFDDGFGTDIRGRVDQSVLSHVLATDGVDDAEGVVAEQYAQYVDQDGEEIGNPGQGAPTFGFSWPTIDQLNPWVLSDGTAPVGPDELVMDQHTADDNGFEVGDTVSVLTQEAPREFTIAGIARFGTADSPAGATVALFSLATAQQVLAEPGKFDLISIVAEDGVSQHDLVANLEAEMPTDQNLEVLSGDAYTQERQDNVKDQLSFFTTFLLVFAVIAVIVGGFVIYNTFGILVAQRGRELALLRAVGASRRQVIGSVLAEALAVATLGSLVGLALGVLLAKGLRAALNAFGVELPTNDLVLKPSTFVIGIILGFIVTTVAAVFPAWRASRIPPVAAMRGVAIDESGHSRTRILAGLLITVIGGLLLAQGLFGGGDNALQAVGIGAALVFVGVTVLGPVLVGPLTTLLGWPAARFRMTGRLARENTVRNPKRTSATAAALMIGVGLVGLITIVASSFTLSIDQAIDDSFTGDFVIDSGSFGFGGLAPALADDLNELPEVDTATGIRYGFAEVDGSGEAMLGVDPTTAFNILEVDILDGSTEALDQNGIGLEEDKAADLGVQAGDTLPVSFAETGVQDLQVAVVFAQSDIFQGVNFLIGRAAYESNFADQFDLQVYVIKAPDVSQEDARVAVEGVADDFANAEVQDVAEFKQAQHDQINQFVSIVYVLLALAVVIALFGIGNTLALSIIERTRELGLLRAVGTTRGQMMWTVIMESVLIAVFGTILGLGIALFFGWAIVEALRDEGLNAFRIPIGSLIIIVVIAGVAGILAAVLPAFRASRLNVLEAIAEN